MNTEKITRMNEYTGDYFKLTTFEDNVKDITHYSHSEIDKYPPDFKNFINKNAKSFEVILEAERRYLFHHVGALGKVRR